MNRKFLHLLPFFALLTFFTPSLSAQTANCQYTIIMADSYGDGWNGGILTVTSGAQTSQFTLAIGFADTMTFDVLNGLPLTFSWVAGAFLGEVSYKILDNIGVIVAQAASPLMPPTGALFAGIGACKHAQRRLISRWKMCGIPTRNCVGRPTLQASTRPCAGKLFMVFKVSTSPLGMAIR